MGRIIPLDRSLIVDCQFNSHEMFKTVLSLTKDLPKVGGYKFGPALCGRKGYDEVVRIIKEQKVEKPLIFDGQKWGTDTPYTALDNLGPLKESGIGAVILFPLAGPKTGETWIKTAQSLGLKVLVGGDMTHEKFLRSEGGYIADEAVWEMYENAANLGVRDFVVPGTKLNLMAEIRSRLETSMGIEDAVYYSPGFVVQGGEIDRMAEVAGERFHAIVGRGIYNAPNMRQSAVDLTSKL